MAGFSHLIRNEVEVDDGKKRTGKMFGIKTINIIQSSHLFETKKGRLVKMPRSPIIKKKPAIIPNIIGSTIEYMLIRKSVPINFS